MTEQQLLNWIKDNLGPAMKQAIAGSVFTEAWLAGICARETGILIMRHVPSGKSFAEICLLMKGDYGKRPNDTQKQYHGFGFWQIDIDSFPGFVLSGKWKDPQESANMAVRALNGKRMYLIGKGWHEKLPPAMFERAITAAYNCGEGNVHKVLTKGLDVDHFTFARDYSKEVFRFRDMYK